MGVPPVPDLEVTRGSGASVSQSVDVNPVFRFAAQRLNRFDVILADADNIALESGAPGDVDP